MIQLPRRSVTRFFIPLIDVLTLLFCIFLLMPYVKRAGAGDGVEPDGAAGVEAKPLPGDPVLSVAQLNRRLEEARRELDRIRSDKAEAIKDRLILYVLEIDPETGKLYFRDPERVEIAGPAEASALIARQKEAAGSKELYYLILFPRLASGYPTQRQYKNYDRWFQGVAHSFDVPGGGR